MNSMFALSGKDFVILAVDNAVLQNIIVLKEEQDAIVNLGANKAMAIVGEAGDGFHFGRMMETNIRLQEMSRDHEHTVNAASHFVRAELARAVRKNPYNVDILIAGIDKIKEGENEKAIPSVYKLDYLGSLCNGKYLASGYCAYFVTALFDQLYKDDMNETEAVDLCKKAIRQLKRRFLLRPTEFALRIISKGGVEDIIVRAE
eukprot:gnl/Chilomastix_caulleri/794.p1 GENE.gnl/Chilomastix_caulleri/794~~gnl/Chilomastix_caulleri/794.p1  ORF type:complete len:203 (+),score=24.68 gnl/Chilomastix_caulleri/794:115-723(+)